MVALGAGITGAGVLAGLGAIIRLLVAQRRETAAKMLRIGHKGADAIEPGNTLESFAAAVEAGVEAIEFDVLRPALRLRDGGDWRRAPAGPANAAAPLVVAHDWGDARRRDPLTLGEALDAFSRPPLDRVRFDLDLKIAGREDEVVAALAERELAGGRWSRRWRSPASSTCATRRPSSTAAGRCRR